MFSSFFVDASWEKNKGILCRRRKTGILEMKGSIETTWKEQPGSNESRPDEVHLGTSGFWQVHLGTGGFGAQEHFGLVHLGQVHFGTGTFRHKWILSGTSWHRYILCFTPCHVSPCVMGWNSPHFHPILERDYNNTINILTNVRFDVQTDRPYTTYIYGIALTILIYLHQENSCYTAWLVISPDNGSTLEID